MRIVTIHAHPDDAEILAGGTLALLAQQQHEIVIVSLSAGDCGSTTHTPDETASIRKAEATAAAAVIGASFRCGGFRDLGIFSDDPSRRMVTALIRELRPDVVLTAAPSDYLCDHEATSQLVRDACFAAPIPNYEVGVPHPSLPAIPCLYFMDPIEQRDRSGSPIPVDFIVNVESTFTTKRAMLAKHQSQSLWLQRQHGIADYIQQMENWTRLCGERAGLALGEGFRQYRGHAYPQQPLLQELLSHYVVNCR